MPTNAKDFEAMQTETADFREDPKMVAGQDALRGKFDEVRSKLQQRFGQLVLAMMELPRYRDQPLSNLRQLLLEPMVRDRVIMASKRDEGKGGADVTAGFAIWASVSDEVDAKIRGQIATGVFPILLRPDDWQSGSTNWLLDVISPDSVTVGQVILSFRHVTGGGEIRIHPFVLRLVDKELLKELSSGDAEKNS